MTAPKTNLIPLGNAFPFPWYVYLWNESINSASYEIKILKKKDNLSQQIEKTSK